MLNTIWLIMAALAFGAVLERGGMLERIVAPTVGFARSTAASVATVVAAAIGMPVSIAFVPGLSLFNRDLVAPYGTARGQLLPACLFGPFSPGFWWLPQLSALRKPASVA